MSIAAKPILAGTLLLGMGAVWVPRLTGFDPFGWLPPELPVSSTIPSSGAEPDAVRTGGSPVGPEPEHAVSADGIPLRSLEEVVSFLERRDKGHAPLTTLSDTSETTQAEAAAEQPVEISAPFGLRYDAPTFGTELEIYFGQYPLHMIVEGGGLTTATFGCLRVQVGDTLMDARLTVTDIDPDGVTLSTPEGVRHVQLPARGALSYYRRPSPGTSDATFQD